uniref:Uncharacterized protein n=1 Tax=Panagrolaimus sp. PS1159 TaxID=55785 RepID=A0AC35F969_9BILA
MSCITLAIASFACYFLIRAFSNSKKLRKLIPFLKLGRKHHRVIKREKCQKRKPRMDSTFDMQLLKRDSRISETVAESPPSRKKSQSVKFPSSQRPHQQLPEILLTAPTTTALTYSNSVPSKQRKQTKDEIIL